MPAPSPDAILGLVVARVVEVMALSGEKALHAPDEWRAVRFAEDLHADSLDLVEVVEGVEADLRAQGVSVHVPDTELVTITSLGDAVDRIAAHTGSSV